MGQDFLRKSFYRWTKNNANKYSFVWWQSNEKNEAKLQENLKNSICEIN